MLFAVSDPRLEAALAPARTSEIIAHHAEGVRGYRPAFVGIVGDIPYRNSDSDDTEAAAYPWLRSMADARDADVALALIEAVIGNELMRDRAFFYLLGSASEPDSVDAANAELARRIIDSGATVRHGFADLDSLARAVLADVLAVFERLQPAGPGETTIQRQRRLHNQFADMHRREYVAFDSYHDRLEDHALGSGVPLILTGASGAGKSALLVNWTDEFRVRHPDVAVITHHVCAASAREDRGLLLRHVLAELQELCGIDEPIPVEVPALEQAFRLWLSSVDRRVVLVLDGLNQLEDADADWLPDDLPDHVRLVVGVTSPGNLVETLLSRSWRELPLKPLTVTQSRAIIDRIVQRLGQRAAGDILRGVSGNAAFPITPFFLRATAHGVQSFGADTQPIDIAGGSPELLMQTILDRSEQRHGRALVARALSLLWCARKGLSVTELADLVSGNHREITAFIVSFGHYLMERDSLYTFVHEHVRRAVEQRYGISGPRVAELHRELARYFGGRPVGERRLDEEPWQWVHAGEPERLAECLADVPMFVALASDERQYELRGYWLTVGDEGAMLQRSGQAFARWRAARHPVQQQAEASARIGRFLQLSGHVVDAERHLRLALQLHLDAAGPESLAVADAMHELAELLRYAGTFNEAEELYSRALRIHERTLPAEHPAIAQALSNLALLYHEKGHYPQALPLYQRALELRERVHGPAHPAVAECLNNLALLYSDQKESDQAVPLFRRALEIRVARFGPNHPAVATLHNNLGGACVDINDFAAAEEHYQTALAIRARMLGPEHPDTILTTTNIAALLYFRKDFERARTMFEQAIALTDRALGADHPQTIGLRVNLAQVLRDSGDRDAACRLSLATLADARRALGDQHYYTAACANNLGGLLRLADDHAAAVPHYELAIAGWEAMFGQYHPNIADALHNLAQVHRDDGDHRIALALLNRALDIRLRALGADHELTLKIREELDRLETGN